MPGDIPVRVWLPLFVGLIALVAALAWWGG